MQNKLTANNNFNYIGFILTVILLSFFPQASANLARITGITTSGGSVPELVYLHNDIMGTPVVVTDKNGNLLWQEERRAYGQVATNASNPRDKATYNLGYTGHQAGNDSGLTYAKARYYNAEIGRFYAPDPIDFRTNDLSSINRYAYAANNPYKYTDPTGELVWFAIPVITGAYFATADVAHASANSNDLQYPSMGDRAVLFTAGVAVGATVQALGAKEAGSEALSVATGGASDVVTDIVSVKKIVKNVAKAADAARSIDPKTLIGRQGKNEMSGSQIKRFRKDMRENGFNQSKPIEVADVDGKLIILDGHHRAKGAIGAGIKEVPVNVNKVTREQADQLMREAAESRL